MDFHHRWSVLLNSWFTSQIMFVFLNLIVLIIIIFSGKFSQKQQPRGDLRVRTSSSLLHRIRSIEFYPSRWLGTTSTLENSPSIDLDRDSANAKPSGIETPEAETEGPEDADSVGGEADAVENKTLDEIYRELKKSKVIDDDKHLPLRKTLKSSSLRWDSLNSEENDLLEKQRPATMRESRISETRGVVDPEVDNKAADFINNFKIQLKLQRIASIVGNN